MYHALIIDDETHVRQTITILGKWESYGFDAPIQASNGQEALLLMEQRHFDLVLVDIKMPVMDGMQFMEQAVKYFPKTKYIIISGFNDFAFAKKAIQYQVQDYLLKPISESELNQCLEKSARDLKEECALRQENPILDSINELCSRAQPDSFGCFALFRILNTSDYIWTTENLQLFEACIQAHAISDGICSLRRLDNYTVFLSYFFPALSKERTLVQIQQRILFHCKNSADALFQNNKILVSGSIGSLNSLSVTHLKQSYQQAKLMLSRIPLHVAFPFITNDWKFYQKYTPCSIATKKPLLLRALEKGDITVFLHTLDLYFHDLQDKSLLTLETLSYNYTELLMLLQDFAHDNDMQNSHEIIPSLFDAEPLIVSQTVPDFLNFFGNVALKLYQQTNTNNQMAVSYILQEIKSYIEENYPQDITLTFFAEKYHLTKEYLSKQFKEQYGYGIYEYVLTFRMQKAADLLLATNLKIHTISIQVGYTDTNYFSKAFKTYFGVSPKEYRQHQP